MSADTYKYTTEICTDNIHGVKNGKAGADSSLRSLAFQSRWCQKTSATLSMRLNTDVNLSTRYVLATSSYVLVVFSSYSGTRWAHTFSFFGDHHRPFKTFQTQNACQFCVVLIFCVHASSIWFRIALGDHCHEYNVSIKALAVQKKKKKKNLANIERGRIIS